MTQQSFTSPVIRYEITEENSSFGIKVYYSEHKNSDDPELSCEIKDFSATIDKALSFAEMLARNCALPVHVPELAEEFLSI